MVMKRSCSRSLRPHRMRGKQDHTQFYWNSYTSSLLPRRGREATGVQWMPRLAAKRTGWVSGGTRASLSNNAFSWMNTPRLARLGAPLKRGLNGSDPRDLRMIREAISRDWVIAEPVMSSAKDPHRNDVVFRWFMLVSEQLR